MLVDGTGLFGEAEWSFSAEQWLGSIARRGAGSLAGAEHAEGTRGMGATLLGISAVGLCDGMLG